MSDVERQLTEEQVGLIRESFARLRPSMVEASELFYQRLFEIAPELRRLFRADLQGQGMRFMTALGEILSAIDDPEALAPHLRRLGEGHAAYGVKPEHFAPMGEALVQTMQEVLGGDLSPETEEAWRQAYARIARQMVALGFG